MTQKIFNIGNHVWVASFERSEYSVPCPDCLGTARMRVIFGDDTQVSIACGGCMGSILDPSTGYIKQWKWIASANLLRITGVEQNVRDGKLKIRYSFDGRSYDDDNTFAAKEEAVARAEELRQAHEDEDNKRMFCKTKDHRSWAWNAAYHRKCIKSAEKDIARHKACLDVAARKAKESPSENL